MATPVLSGDILVIATLVLRKANLDSLDEFVPVFHDPTFLCEPWAWLLAMIKKGPSRQQMFTDDLESPGPWLTAFAAAVELEFRAEITPPDVALLVSAFKSTMRDYFTWKALGASEREGRRMLRELETGTLRSARMLLARLLGRRVQAVTNEHVANVFLQHVAVAELQLPPFFRSSLASVMKSKGSAHDKPSSTILPSKSASATKSLLPAPESASTEDAGPVQLSNRQVKKQARAARWKDKKRQATKTGTETNAKKSDGSGSPSRLQKAAATQAIGDGFVKKKNRP